MNRILKLVASIFLVVAFCFAYTMDTVSAASNSTSAQDKKAMRAFRDSILATTNDKNQILHQFFIFMLPGIQSEFEFNAKVTGHSMDMAGNFGLWLTGDDAKITDLDIPFYLTQNGNDMVLYYKTDDAWTKYSMPSVAGALTDLIASPTKEEIDREISTIKNVTILQENENRRTLLVHLDSAKLADEIKAEVEKNPADKGTAEDSALQNKIMGYLDTGIRNADIWYIWRVDKKNHKTGVIMVDLSQIVQETARAVLDDPDNQDLPDEIKEILENFVFYSEFKASTTFLGSDAQNVLTVPQEVIDTAKEAKDIVPADVPTDDSTK